eukprot:TRINITY_DN37045_c0_g1_i1.p1 TRINITY_DN37045_c0_g1~~TRINITY_DN37045_c0_g1_i1.p1  ORF type:complete len:588 (-),score=137.16 TRINITY_DN37045_c0_g1_i1:91-1854(-)
MKPLHAALGICTLCLGLLIADAAKTKRAQTNRGDLLTELAVPRAGIKSLGSPNFEDLIEAIEEALREGNVQFIIPVVEAAEGMVKEEVLPKIMHQKDLLQRELDNKQQDFYLCTFNDVLAFNGNISQLSQKHKACRLEQAALYQDAEHVCSLVAIYAAEMRAACLHLDFPSSVPDVCERAEANPLEEHYHSLVTFFRDKLSKYHLTKEACGNATNMSTAQNKSCQDKLDIYNRKRQECDAWQRKLDEAACRQFIRESTCIRQTQCYLRTADEIYEHIEEVKLQEEALKTQWLHLQKLICFLNLVGNESSRESIQENLFTCSTTTQSNHSLNLTYPKVSIPTNGTGTAESNCQQCLDSGQDFCIEENRCTPRATYTCMDPADHITGSGDFSLYGNPRMVFKMTCPSANMLPICDSPNVDNQPGTLKYKEQEYVALPPEASAAPCEAECCVMCNFYQGCPQGTYRKHDAARIRGYSAKECCQGACAEDACPVGFTPKDHFVANCSVRPCPMSECCDPVEWTPKEKDWEEITCPSDCEEAFEQRREVRCVTKSPERRIVQNETACAGRKPTTERMVCEPKQPGQPNTTVP